MRDRNARLNTDQGDPLATSDSNSGPASESNSAPPAAPGPDTERVSHMPPHSSTLAPVNKNPTFPPPSRKLTPPSAKTTPSTKTHQVLNDCLQRGPQCPALPPLVRASAAPHTVGAVAAVTLHARRLRRRRLHGGLCCDEVERLVQRRQGSAGCHRITRLTTTAGNHAKAKWKTSPPDLLTILHHTTRTTNPHR